VALPANDLRSNAGTWAIPNCQLPRIAQRMTSWLAKEQFDPGFDGQELCTYYFDTLNFDLRKARLKNDKYCTVRLRTYQPGGQANGTAESEEAYALSIKTLDQKFRKPLSRAQALTFMPGIADPAVDLDFLPGDLLARLLDVSGGKPLIQAVEVRFRRYAVEDKVNRLTLDIDIKTNTGKSFPGTGILENKTTRPDRQPMPEILALGYAPVRLSKFLWATTYGVR
jgi:hypothetical protein